MEGMSHWTNNLGKEKISRTSDGLYNKGVIITLKVGNVSSDHTTNWEENFCKPKKDKKKRSPAGAFPCEPMTELPGET